MDKVRYLKLLVYEGPRDVIEEHIKNTLFGVKHLSLHKTGIDGEYTITGHALLAFPELVLPNQEVEIIEGKIIKE